MSPKRPLKQPTLRQQLRALQPGMSLTIADTARSEATVRNAASQLGYLEGISYRVIRNRDDRSVTVTRL